MRVKGEDMADKAQNAANLIMSDINGNQHIHDASHLSIDAKAKGFLFWKKTEILLSGRVETDREKEEIDKILETGSKDFAVVNNVRVHKR